MHETIYLMKRRLEWASHVSLRGVGQVGTPETWKRVSVMPGGIPERDKTRQEDSKRVTEDTTDVTIP